MLTIEEAKKIKLSRNFSLWEFLYSDNAYKYGYVDEQLKIKEDYINNLKALCLNILQPLRDRIGASIIISSGYRSLSLNTKIVGSKNSDHMKGLAADIYTPDMLRAWSELKRMDFDQLIKYGAFRFIHVSLRTSGNRKQILEKP